MHWRYVISTVGLLNFFLATTMVIPICFAIYYGDDSFTPLAKSIAITVLAGSALYIFFRYKGSSGNISQREGIAIVSIGWVTVSFFGALPFYLSSYNFAFVDAFFESVSGFTTTGATIIGDIESQPRGLLLWRSLIQWLGGMGIIVLSIAILPFMKISGGKLYKAEVPSPIPDKLKPKIRDTAVILWKVYLYFSIIELVLLMLGGMSFFDGLCHTFTTMPTGGFSTMNSSIGHFNSCYIDVVTILFMVLAGINFSLHYQMLRGNVSIFWKDSECRFFLAMCVILTIVVAIDTHGKVYDCISESLRYSLFQVVSIITSTGFITSDYELWPSTSKLIIMLCMFVGSSAGSTGGGMKCLRLILCFKYCYKELFAIVHPRAVRRIKINGKSFPEEVLRNIFGFLSMYLMLFVFSSILLSGMGVDCITAVSAVAASIGNVGPGFGLVGPANNYVLIPTCGKWLLAWCMLLGRLEIYTLIVLLVPEFWRK